MFITQTRSQIFKLTRLRVVDNSAIGKEALLASKPVKCIHIYNKNESRHGGVGDKVLVTILGQMKKGYVVGCVAKQRTFVPRYDSNNVVLVDNNDVPLGTRITYPIPNCLRKRGPEVARLMAVCTKFV